MAKTVQDFHKDIDAIMDGRAKMGRDGSVNHSDPDEYVGDDKTLVLDDDIKANGKEAPGTIRNFVDKKGVSIVYRKQVGGKWAPADSPADLFGTLTKAEQDDILGSMANEDITPTAEPTKRVKKNAGLIPGADLYLDNGFNVLLISLHGVGKTESIKQLAEARGMKMKYFSCSTLDPYTDLVGIPTPRDYCPECVAYFKDEPTCPTCGGKTIEALKNVRPREVDEAELIFFDEMGRADSKTMNAIFEIIQFGSINGDPLPNLRACWAAMNPPSDEQNYQVEQLDPALLDRFDVYINMTPKPSVAYMCKHMPEPIARALKRWWDDHQGAIIQGSKDAHADYVSPRRLEKIGLVWCATKSSKSVYAALPQGGTFEKQKLVDFLKSAQREVDQYANAGQPMPAAIDDPLDEDDEDIEIGPGLGNRPWDGIPSYLPANLQLHADKLAKFLKQYPTEYETHKEVVKNLKQGVGGEELILKHAKVLNALSPSSLEGLIAGFPGSKISAMRQGFIRLYKDDPTAAKELTELHKQLNQGSPTLAGWPKSL